MQVLVDELVSANVKHVLKLDDDGRCTHLFIMPKISEQLTAEFHDFIQMDSIYRTNRYNMPLLHIVGHTNTNRTFTIAVCFMRSEKTGDYQWALEAFRELAGEHFHPEAIVTDRELALMNAIQLVFPVARHILCAWHIGKNILAKCKALFPMLMGDTRQHNLLTWEEFSLSWSSLVLKTLDRGAFFEGWSSLKSQIPSEARDYIEYQWLTPWKTRFCATFIQDVRHFGTLTTSRVEGCHAALKTWIPSSSLNLLAVYKAVNKHCTRQNEICITEREVQRQSVLLSVRNVDFFKDVHSIISHQGLKIVYREYQKARAELTEPCNSYLVTCFGLPCSHLIRDMICSSHTSASSARLRFDNFHVFWLLDKAKTLPVLTNSTVLSPARIQNPRGRPRGTKRLPSEFELVEAPRPLRNCGLCKMPANHNRSTCPKSSINHS